MEKKFKQPVKIAVALFVIGAAYAGCAGLKSSMLHLGHDSEAKILTNHKIALIVDGNILKVQDRDTGGETLHRIHKTFMVKGVRVFVLKASDSGFGITCGSGINRMIGGLATMLIDVDSLDVGPVVLLKKMEPGVPDPNTYTQLITAGITDDPDERESMRFENMVIHEMTHVIFMDTQFLPKEGSEAYRFSETAAVLSEMAYGHTLITYERVLTQKYFIDLAEDMGMGDAMEENAASAELAFQVSETLDRLMFELDVHDVSMIQYFKEKDLRNAAARALDSLCVEHYFSSSQSLIDPSVYDETIAMCKAK